MRLIVTGHRDHKLTTYDCDWIGFKILEFTGKIKNELGVSLAYSGMASGVDLLFCNACNLTNLPYISCIPFEEQADTMTAEVAANRQQFIDKAVEVKYVKNSWMVENCDCAIVVWDGNKGGTHNVVQQLVEKKKNFYWINPVAKVVWKCFI